MIWPQYALVLMSGNKAFGAKFSYFRAGVCAVAALFPVNTDSAWKKRLAYQLGDQRAAKWKPFLTFKRSSQSGLSELKSLQGVATLLRGRKLARASFSS